MRSNWLVAVLYEDSIARGEAQVFCDQLVAALWREQGFDFDWWSFDSMSDSTVATEVAEKTAKADVVVWANRQHSAIPSHIREWTEEWLRYRGFREGVLVGLSEPTGDSTQVSAGNYAFLRELAHRAGMDYMNEVPQNLGWVIPECPEDFTLRASEMSSTLDSILKRAKSLPVL